MFPDSTQDWKLYNSKNSCGISLPRAIPAGQPTSHWGPSESCHHFVLLPGCDGSLARWQSRSVIAPRVDPHHARRACQNSMQRKDALFPWNWNRGSNWQNHQTKQTSKSKHPTTPNTKNATTTTKLPHRPVQRGSNALTLRNVKQYPRISHRRDFLFAFGGDGSPGSWQSIRKVIRIQSAIKRRHRSAANIAKLRGQERKRRNDAVFFRLWAAIEYVSRAVRP